MNNTINNKKNNFPCVAGFYIIMSVIARENSAPNIPNIPM